MGTESGFYSPPREDAFADDFVFIGQGSGPMDKDEYLGLLGLGTLGWVYKAFPDIVPNAFGFAVDPDNPRRVCIFIQNTGTDSLPFAIDFLGFFYGFVKVGRTNIEVVSVIFDEVGKVKELTVGV